MLSALKAPLRAGGIIEMRDGIFYAELVFGGASGCLPGRATRSRWRCASVRPSARRRGAGRGGLIIPDEQEDEVEKFREFLELVCPEDFAG